MGRRNALGGEYVALLDANGTPFTSGLATPAAPTCTPSNTGGTLTNAHGAYGYVVYGQNELGKTVASAETQATIAAGTTGSVAISGNAPTGATSVVICGRTVGAELQMITVGVAGDGTYSWTDTGAVAPSGALPQGNTTVGRLDVRALLYHSNSNPLATGSVLSGIDVDRARNVNGKGLGSGSISNNPLAVGSTTLTLNAGPTTLVPGQMILLDRAGTNPETAFVGASYTPGATAVPLQFGTVFSHAQNATVEWDQHAPTGPGASGFLGHGLGMSEEAVWDALTRKFFLEQSATADSIAGTSVPMMTDALYNAGTGNFDRPRTPTVFKSGAAGAITAGTPVAGWTPTTGKKFRLMALYLGKASTATEVILKDGSTEFGRIQPAIAGGASAMGGLYNLNGNGYPSTAANNVLNLDVTTTVTTLDFWLIGTEE